MLSLVICVIFPHLEFRNRDLVAKSRLECIKRADASSNKLSSFTPVPDNFTMAATKSPSHPSPLTKSGALDKQFKYEEATPVIGREYSEVNIVDDILNASNADDLIRDLAITSQF